MNQIPADVITIVSVLISSVAGPTIVEYVKNIFRKKEFDPVQDSLENNILVENKVERIKEEFGADRVYILQFHNGGQFFPSGKSMKKFSMFYESINPSISSLTNQFQNIPISLFSRSLDQLAKNDSIVIPDFSDNNSETYGLKYIAEENNNKSSYLFSIKSIDGKFVGVLGINYTEIATTLNSSQINHLAVEATAIGGVLMHAHLK